MSLFFKNKILFFFPQKYIYFFVLNKLLLSQFRCTIEILRRTCYTNHEIFRRNCDNWYKSCDEIAIQIMKVFVAIATTDTNLATNLLYKPWKLYSDFIAIYHVFIALATTASNADSSQFFYLIFPYFWVCDYFPTVSLFRWFLYLVILAMIFFFCRNRDNFPTVVSLATLIQVRCTCHVTWNDAWET